MPLEIDMSKVCLASGKQPIERPDEKKILSAGSFTTIDFEATERQIIGYSLDLRSQYPDNEEGGEFLISALTVMDPIRLEHLRNHTDVARMAILKRAPELVEVAITTPDIVYSHLRYVGPHWSQVFAVEDRLRRGHYVVVVVNLAHAGEPLHKIWTIHPAEDDFFFRSTKKDRRYWTVKDRWVVVEKKRASS